MTPTQKKYQATLNGVRPRKGLLITRGDTVYGIIMMVRKTGVVVWWHPSYGVKVETEPQKLVEGGYAYKETR